MVWKYLLFDLDGTLTDSKEGILKCIRHALKEMKKPIPPEEELMESTMDGSRNEKTDIIREVFVRLGITQERKKEVIMIEDRKYDILGAKECNIEALGVSYGFAQKMN